jgi:hypothetical protein
LTKPFDEVRDDVRRDRRAAQGAYAGAGR